MITRPSTIGSTGSGAQVSSTFSPSMTIGRMATPPAWICSAIVAIAPPTRSLRLEKRHPDDVRARRGALLVLDDQDASAQRVAVGRDGDADRVIEVARPRCVLPADVAARLGGLQSEGRFEFLSLVRAGGGRRRRAWQAGVLPSACGDEPGGRGAVGRHVRDGA